MTVGAMFESATGVSRYDSAGSGDFAAVMMRSASQEQDGMMGEARRYDEVGKFAATLSYVSVNCAGLTTVQFGEAGRL